jgi:hypothetical protein
MDKKKLISHLQKSALLDSRKTPFCPDDTDIAAFVEGTLDDSKRLLIDRHLPDCQACVSWVGLLTRLLRDDSETELGRWRAAPQWAVAASLVLAFSWLVWSPQIDDAAEYQTARSVEPVMSPPEILAPESGVLVNRDGFLIRWTGVPGSLYYEVRVVSASGDLLSEERVEATEWSLSNEIRLEPGQEYFIRVDAYLSDAKAISSQHIPFRLRD